MLITLCHSFQQSVESAVLLVWFIMMLISLIVVDKTELFFEMSPFDSSTAYAFSYSSGNRGQILRAIKRFKCLPSQPHLKI